MWVAIHITGSKPAADKIVQILSDEGFLAKTSPAYKNVSSKDNHYEILVLKSEAYDARNILLLNGYWK